MRKFIITFICALVVALSLGSCSGEAFDETSVNKQTIFVFFPWTGSNSNSGLLGSLKINVDSMCAGIVAQKGLTNSRVLVFLSESANSSKLFELQYDATAQTVNQVPLNSYTGTEHCTADGFASLLNEVKEKAEALNYALIIGAHGSGWTYSSDWVNYPSQARPHNGGASAASDENFSGIYFGYGPGPHTRFFGSTALADQAIDVTTLAEGIKKSGMKMQYILFDACYMGNVETAYELKDVTNYMIASSSEIMGDGLPYKSIWTYLNSATPNYSSIVTTSVNFYKTTKLPYLNLAAVDCRQMDKLASVMKEINQKYTLASTVPLDSIQPLDGFNINANAGKHLFYDMSVYVDSLCPSGYLKDQYTSQMALTVKAAGHTDKAYTALPSYARTFDMKSYCGLSISDPSQHSVALKGKEKTGWWKATH